MTCCPRETAWHAGEWYWRADRGKLEAWRRVVVLDNGGGGGGGGGVQAGGGARGAWTVPWEDVTRA